MRVARLGQSKLSRIKLGVHMDFSAGLSLNWALDNDCSRILVTLVLFSGKTVLLTILLETRNIVLSAKLLPTTRAVHIHRGNVSTVLMSHVRLCWFRGF